MPDTFDFIEDARPATTEFDFQPDAEERPGIRERIEEGFKTLPEPVQRISKPAGWQEPAMNVSPFWTTPPWVPVAKAIGFPQVAGAGEAMAEETAKMASGLTIPLNLGLVAATKAYPPLGIAISASMIPQIYEGGKQAYKGAMAGDIPEVVRGGTKAAIGTAGAVLGTLPLASKLLPRASAEAIGKGPLPGTQKTRTGTVRIERSDVPKPGPESLSQDDVNRLFLDKLNQESNREIEQAAATPKPPPLTPTEQAEARADLAAEMGEEAPKPTPPPEPPPTEPEAKAPAPAPPAKVEAPAASPSQLSPTDKGITPQEKAFRATAEGQKAMASRASRIAVLNQINEAIRKIDPKEAYDRALLEQTPDSQIDSMMESLRQDYNRLVAKPEAKPAAETGKETPLVGFPKSERTPRTFDEAVRSRLNVGYTKPTARSAALIDDYIEFSEGHPGSGSLIPWSIRLTPEGMRLAGRDNPYITKANDLHAVAKAITEAKAKSSQDAPSVAAAAKVEQEVKAVAKTEGQRSAKEVKSELVQRLEQAIKDAPSESEVRATSYTKADMQRVEVPDRAEMVTIDIPGDGTFKIRNTKEALEGILKRAKRISTESIAPKATFPKGAVQSSEKALRKMEEAKEEQRVKGLGDLKAKARVQMHDALNKSPEEGIIGHTRPEEDPAIDGGTLFKEYRLRKTTPQEQADFWKSDRREVRWIGEMRVVRFDPTKGRTENEWGYASSGKTYADAMRQIIGDAMPANAVFQNEGAQAWHDLEYETGKFAFLSKEPKPTETPPTGPGMELSMSIIPPQLKRSLKTFAVQDIAPALRAGVNTGKAAKDAIIHAFSPTSAAKPRVVDTMFKSKGYAEQVMTQAASAMEEANKQVRVMPRAEQIAFVDRVKRGQTQPTPELQDLADLMRRWDDYLYSEAQVYKPSLNYLDNHLRVLWKVIPGRARRGTSQQQILSKRPWRGSQGFTKRHVLDDMSEGIALGGEPVSYNPVEMFLLHAQDVMKFVAANRAWQSLKGTGDVTFVKFGKKAPDDFVRINDSISKAYFRPQGMKGVRAQTGEWWVQKDAARLIENYLSKDRIRNNPVGRALMGLKNATTAIELGLSPFHAVFESLETMGSTFGLGLSKIASGDIVSGLKTVLSTPVSPKTVSKLGRAGVKYAKNAADFQATEPEAYNWFVSKYPGAAQLIDDMFAGGGQIGMHQDYKFKAGTGFGQALQEGNYPGAVLRAIPALNQAVMKPLFQTYIPRLKVGTFLREYSFELSRRADDIAAGKITREQLARQTWAFVEDRFGEMNFDNLYWDRTFKSALQLLFRSVTWKLGNLRGFGKAARDATAELGWRWFTEGRAPEMTMPMAWALGMSVTTAAISSLVTKASTGKYPWELAEHSGDLVKNLVFPRISLTDESQRVSTPTYWRDAVHLSHSVPDYVRSSMSGEKGRITDVWDNRDFYGVQVYNPDDPIPQKVAQAMQHLIPVPFGASSWLAAERTGATKNQALAGFFGFTKAPYYVSHTAAEQKALELMRSRMPQGSRTREEFERSIRERQAVEAIKRGDMTIQEAFRDGLVDQPRMKQIQKRASEPLLENLAGRLSTEDAMRVYAAAEPEEKDRLKFGLQQKILRSKKTPEEKGQMLVDLER